MSITSPQPTENLTPQLVRILKLAAIECDRDSSNQAGKVGVEHIMVAALQDDTNFLSILLKNCGLSVSDLRNGNLQPKPATA